MSDYFWCHGPKCHTCSTQDRVRGSKGSKVLRTRKVKQHINSVWYKPDNFLNYFCSQGCYNDFANTYAQQIIKIAPRNEPLETRIEDPKKVTRHSTYNPDYSWTETEIKKIDTDSNVG